MTIEEDNKPELVISIETVGSTVEVQFHPWTGMYSIVEYKKGKYFACKMRCLALSKEQARRMATAILEHSATELKI